MRRGDGSHQVFIKSHGFGVYQACVMPTPEVPDSKFISLVLDGINNSGVPVQEIIFDGNARAFFISPDGFEASQYERAQTEESDLETMRRIAVSNVLLRDRLRLIRGGQ